MVTHPGTNRVWRSATTLIEAKALPLSQTALDAHLDIWLYCSATRLIAYESFKQAVCYHQEYASKQEWIWL